MRALGRYWKVRYVRPFLVGLGLVTALAAGHAGASKDAPAGPRKPPSPPPAASLADRIDALLGEAFLNNARVGVHVRDLATGKILVNRGGTEPLNPASNVKLVTIGAALALLGPEHRYPTRAYAARGTRRGDTITGDIYLRGSGDPALVTADLYELASDLRARGIKKITGGIVVDATRFDRDELPPGYDQKDEFASYRALTGATTVNFNTFVVRVRPGDKPGDPVLAAIDPPVGSIELVNRASTVADGHRGVTVVPEPLDDRRVRITLKGTLGRALGGNRWRYPIQDPSRYAGEVFGLVLRQRGIRVGRRAIKARARPARVELLATHFSPALSELARSVNKLSNNFMAEQILKTLDPADTATYAGALDRVRTWLKDKKLADAGLRYGNGSGLYDTNRVTPAMMTKLLGHMYRDFRVSSDFLASLAVMGADGTTRNRLADSPAKRWVRGKTGTLNEVSALSGYAGAANRAPLAFSILVNNLDPGEVGRTRLIQDAISELLAEYAANHR